MTKVNKLAGISLILAALAVFAAIVVRTDHSQNSMVAQVADVEASRGPEFVAAGLFVLGAILFVPAGLGIARLAQGRGRGTTLTYVGAFLLTTGGLWFATGRAIPAHLLYGATAPRLPREEALAGFLYVTSSPSFVIFLPFLLSFIMAPIVLALSLRRMGPAPVRAPTNLPGAHGTGARDPRLHRPRTDQRRHIRGAISKSQDCSEPRL